jgi:hypothetical protein
VASAAAPSSSLQQALAFDREGALVLRIAFATPVAMVIADLLNLQLTFMASVLALSLLPSMKSRPPIMALVMIVGVIVLFTSGLVGLLKPLLANLSTYLAVLGAMLFILFRLQGHPKFGALAALALPMLVILSPLIPIADQFATGLARLLGQHAVIAVMMVIAAWLVFPGPPLTAATPPPPPAPRRSVADAAISALIMMGLIAATLALNAVTALRLLVIASSVLAVTDPRLSVDRALVTIGATLAGVLVAWVLNAATALASTMAMLALLAALVPLLIGRRFADPVAGPFWTMALTAMWVLLGADGSVSGSKLISFTILTVGGVAVAIGLRHTLLWHFGSAARAQQG